MGVEAIALPRLAMKLDLKWEMVNFSNYLNIFINI